MLKFDGLEVGVIPNLIRVIIPYKLIEKNQYGRLMFDAVPINNEEFITNITCKFNANKINNVYSSKQLDYILKNKIATLEGINEPKFIVNNKLVVKYILKLTKSFIKKCMLKQNESLATNKATITHVVKSKESIKMPTVKQNQFSVKLSKDKGWLFIKDKFGEVVRQLYIVNYIKSKSKNIYFYFKDEKRDDQILKFLIKSQTAKLVRTDTVNDTTYYELKLLDV